MTYKLYRCGSKYTGNPKKLTFLAKNTDRDELILKATIEADGILAWMLEPTGKITYGYRSYPGEPSFAISTHKEAKNDKRND